MPPFGFGRKEQPQSFTTDITDKDDLEEISKIAYILNPNEEVFFSFITSPAKLTEPRKEMLIAKTSIQFDQLVS